jgi:hypothetical protein
MPEYVSKLRATVVVCQVGQEQLEGSLSLSPQAEFHDGPETILERLNARDRILPFHRREDGAVLLLSRLELEWVAAGRGVGRELVCPRNYQVTREERVQVRFTSGNDMFGLLQMELPEMLNRASDFLNGEDDFFPLVTEQGVVLLNKTHVLYTRVYESSPLPLGTGGESHSAA